MNPKKTWKLAEVLMLSAVRARKGNSILSNDAKSDLINTKIAAVGFPLIAVITYIFVSRTGLPPSL